MSILVKVLAICVLISLTKCDLKGPIFIPCHKADIVCQTVSAQLAYQNIITGIPSLGIVPSDPLYQKEISGTINKFIYNFTDVSTTGAKGCVVRLIRLDRNLVNLKLNLACGNATIKGKYDIKGEYIGRKVNESSNFTTWTTSYVMEADMKLDQKLGGDGKKHLVIVDVITHAGAIGPIWIKLKNSDDFEKFLNEHQKENGVFIGRTFADANLKTVAARANTFLNSVSIDDLFITFKFNSLQKYLNAISKIN